MNKIIANNKKVVESLVIVLTVLAIFSAFILASNDDFGGLFGLLALLVLGGVLGLVWGISTKYINRVTFKVFHGSNTNNRHR